MQDVENESRFPKMMPLIRQAGVRSFCTVPLTTARRRIGAMGVGTRELHHYDAAEIEFLQQAAKQVAVARGRTGLAVTARNQQCLGLPPRTQ